MVRVLKQNFKYRLLLSIDNALELKFIKSVDKKRIENELLPIWYMKMIYGIQLSSEYEHIEQVKN